jgi:hypothetical protein
MLVTDLENGIAAVATSEWHGGSWKNAQTEAFR